MSTEKYSVEEHREDTELRRGPWTLEEDTMLIQYIASHGDGHWNMLARCSGLKRTGKSCRLRWLNYLKPDIKRGNLTPQEKSAIFELHCKWGNRWSKIAQHLPGRTDNEIKNYWRTRVQNQARQLKRVGSERFLDSVRGFWVPPYDQTNEETVGYSSAYASTPLLSSQEPDEDHYVSLSSPRSSTLTLLGNKKSLELPELNTTTSDLQISSSADINSFYNNNKSQSDPGCYFGLEDLALATMSPIRADDCGLYPDCRVGNPDWMLDHAADTECYTDELWHFR